MNLPQLIGQYLSSPSSWLVWLLFFSVIVRFTVKESGERIRIILMIAAVFGGIYLMLLFFLKYQHADPQKILKLFRYDKEDPLVFNSSFFLYFFTLFMLFFLIVYKQKLTRVIVFSLFSLFFFYKACGWYVIFILVAAVVDFFLSNAIYKTKEKDFRVILLLISLVLNLGLLFVFKYTNFFIGTINDISNGHIEPLHLILPVGISFYTFENLSYTLDVYRGHFKPVSNFFDYLFFLSFFPKLMMGPIVRASDFVPQIRQDISIQGDDVGAGLYQILTGIFKKVVISDFIWLNFGQYVFDDPSKHSGVECLFGVYCYALVIYCDFSGYSDMAIGMARWMGFKIPANFDSPYQSSSITEFWRRWHISLSSWLRDYLYISFGGNRKGSAGTWIVFGLFYAGSLFASVRALVFGQVFWPLLALLAVTAFIFLPALIFRKEKNMVTTSLNQLNTMLIGGLWHGASWNFLFWGFLHGMALSFDKIRMKISDMLPSWYRKGYSRLCDILAFIAAIYFFRMIGLLVTGDLVYAWIIGIALTALIAGAYYLGKEKISGKKLLGVLITFHFVCLCWVYFKCESFGEATVVLRQIVYNFAPETFMPMLKGYGLVFSLMGFSILVHLLLPREGEDFLKAKAGSLPLYAKILVVVAGLWLIVQFKQAEQMLPIYLQF